MERKGTKHLKYNKWKLTQYEFSRPVVSAQQFKIPFEGAVTDYDFTIFQDCIKKIIKRYIKKYSVYVEVPQTHSKYCKKFCCTISLYFKTEDETEIKKQKIIIQPILDKVDELIEVFKKYSKNEENF